MTHTVNAIRDELKQTRLQSNEENYETKMALYGELLAFATIFSVQVVSTMRKNMCVGLWAGRRMFSKVPLSRDLEPLFGAIEAKMNVGK